MNIRMLLSAAIVLVLAISSLPLLDPKYFLSWKPRVSPVADLIVRNGVIYTSDNALLFADSMAVGNGRVLRVGNYSFVQELADYRTKELDLGRKIVVPGFIDSHVHFIYGGLQMAQVELRGVNKKEDFIKRIKDAVKSSKQGSWILGGGWNNDLWGGDLPSASWIDDFTQNNPVWLSRMDGHMGLANSVALKLAGVKRYSKDPLGGTIMRTASGEPTGLLIDSAKKFVGSQIPEDSVDDRREALLRASNLALSRGVTTVVDMGRYLPGGSSDLSWVDFSDVYQWADSLLKMKVRVCLFFPMETWILLKTGFALSQWLYLGGVKAFADGSLGSNSALLYEPYVDEPDNYGLQVTDAEVLLNLTLKSDLSGLQVAIHAIGDRANDLILDMYSLVASTNGMRDRRFRIEHAQQLASGTPGRFGKQGVIASVQPDQILDDAESAGRKLGKDRAEKESYLFKSLLDGNALVAMGSDWPVADINPLSEDALKGYTIAAARASFLENQVGSLSPGKFADFVILSADSWEEFAVEASASVEATYVSGVLAYS
ncbi:hypothetical protein K1719_042523 [Acacia pycnantha]|nr:hypothetical protein K1719_042523 [Acacia pycnantha]